jgi:hypothetical protein
MSTIIRGDDYFATVTYTGTGSAQTISGLRFQPDLVWIKIRSQAFDHTWVDAVRGTGKDLESSSTAAEDTRSTVTAFGSDGFTVGTDSQVNSSGNTFVAWCWNAGGSTVINTDGTISSNVRANPTAGFSIVTYTGTGADATVGHGLGVAPAMVIVKGRSFVDNWEVYHSALPVPATDAVRLNTTGAKFTVSGYWNGGTTSSVFGISNYDQLAKSGETFVAYCFAAVPGYSAFGSYVGNGSEPDGVFVYLGFRPRWILIKRTTQTESWILVDSVRSPVNLPTNLKYLLADTNGAEVDNSVAYDFLSNGIKFRNPSQNQNGATYVYAAFAENPFSYSLAR